MRGNHHTPNGTTLSVWQVVELARHSLRPYSHDYLRRLVPDFVELHDRFGALRPRCALEEPGADLHGARRPAADLLDDAIA